MAKTTKARRPKPARALTAAKPPAKVTNGKGKEPAEPKQPVVETMVVPVALILAAESIVAKAAAEKAYLHGVMLHQKDGGAGRIVGTDGHRLFVGSYPVPAKPPSWLKDGLMLPADDLKARVSVIAKVGDSDLVLIKHAKGNAVAYLSDATETMVFKIAVGDVKTFPEYEQVFGIGSFTDMTEDGEMRGKREWEPVGFNSRHLRHCGDIAKILEAAMPKEAREKNGMTIRVFDNGEATAPRVFDFLGWPGAVLVIGGQVTQTTLPLATARILAPAVKLTVAALRAHATRWLDAAKKASTPEAKAECMAKAEGFQARVAEVLARTPDLEVKAIGTDKPQEEEPTAEDEPAPATPPVAVLTKAEKAAATRKRRAAATLH